MTLFESFDEIANDEFIDRFKTYSNENNAKLDVAVKGIFYTLLAGLIRKTYSDMSAGMLFNQIQENAKKINLPAKLSEIFDKPSEIKEIETAGTKIISQVFPAYKSPLLSMISTYSNTSKATTTLAANIVANVLVSLFKKDIESGKMDKEQMVVQLRQHQEPLLDTVPESLLERMIPALGLHDLMKVRPYTPKKEKLDNQPKQKEESRIEETSSFLEPQESSGSKLWVVALIVGILAVGGGLYYWFSQNGGFSLFGKKEVPVESLETPVDSLITDSTAVSLDTVATEATPSSTDEYMVFEEYVNGTEAAGKEFDFSTIKFDQDTTTVSSASTEIVGNIASLMQKNPKLQVKISAFSKSGDNKLNTRRAFYVKRLITAKGVNPIRIDAVAGETGDDFAKIKVISK